MKAKDLLYALPALILGIIHFAEAQHDSQETAPDPNGEPIHEIKSQLLQLWSNQVNQQLMQRSLFITAMSVLYAAGIFLAGRHELSGLGIILFILLTAVAVFVNASWARTQKDRGDDVDYLRSRLFWAENASADKVRGHAVWSELTRWRNTRNNKLLRCGLVKNEKERKRIKQQMQDEVRSIDEKVKVRDLFKSDLTRKLMKWIQRLFYLLWLFLFLWSWSEHRQAFSDLLNWLSIITQSLTSLR